MKRWLSLLALVLLLAGCSGALQAPPPMEGASITGARLNQDAAGGLMPFSVPVAEPGEPIGVDLRGTVGRGSLSAQLRDAEGRVVWQVRAGVGPFAFNDIIKPQQAGRYELALVWDGPVTASYSLRWQPGAVVVASVTPMALLGGLGMTLVALAFVAWAAWRRLGWRYLGLGALAWVVTVALKFAWSLSVNATFYNALQAGLPAPLSTALFCVYVGSLTGIFEVGLVWLLLRYTRLGQVGWPRALAFGIGFGAVEALLLGLLSLGPVVAALAMPAVLPPDALVGLARLNDPLVGLAPIVERLATLYLHLLANALVFYAASRRRAGAFWLAFAYKTAIDSVAAFGQLWGLGTTARLWTIEAVVIAFGIAGWLGLRRLAVRYGSGGLADGHAIQPTPDLP